MYESFFGLREKPFNLTPDPRYFYLSESHREALAALIYGVRERVGLITLTGPVGVGKTMILTSFLNQIQEHADAVLFSGSISGSRVEFLRDLCSELGIRSEQDSLFGLSQAIKYFAIQEAGEERQVVVLVDEAQDLGLEGLEHFHHLSNLETPDTKLLQIVLAGTEKLDEKLRDKSLEALWQRVSIRCVIEPIEPEETIAYIFHRMRVAGSSSSRLFSEDALWRIVNYSRGVPRLINLICNQAMLSAYSSGESLVGEDSVLEALKELEGDRSDNGKGEIVGREGIRALVEKVGARPEEGTVSLEEEEAAGREEGEEAANDREGRGRGRFFRFRRRMLLALLLFLLLALAVVGVLISTGVLKPGAALFEDALAEARKEFGAGAGNSTDDNARPALPAPGTQDAEAGRAVPDEISRTEAERAATKGETREELPVRRGTKVTVRQQDFAGIALEHYGRLDAEILKSLRETNPQIRDWNNLTRSVQIVLPDVPQSTDSGADFYTIQVGAFREKEGAGRRASDLANRGIQNVFLVKGGEGERLTFVCAGVFESGRQSSEGVGKIREMGFEEAFSTRIREKRLEDILQPYAGLDAAEPPVEERRTMAEGFPRAWE